MKRFIAISLLLCANLILLAHSIVPHHHHNGVMVSLQVHVGDDYKYKSDHKHHQHNSDNPETHDHKDGPISENCLLYNLLTRYVIGSREDCDILSSDLNFTPWYALCPDQPQLVALEGRRIKHRPYLLLRHAVPDVASNPLRGPPFC